MKRNLKQVTVTISAHPEVASHRHYIICHLRLSSQLLRSYCATVTKATVAIATTCHRLRIAQQLPPVVSHQPHHLLVLRRHDPQGSP